MSQGLRQVTVSNAPQVQALKVTSSATTAGMRAWQAPGFEKPYKGSIVLPSRSGKRIHVQSFCLNKEVACLPFLRGRWRRGGHLFLTKAQISQEPQEPGCEDKKRKHSHSTCRATPLPGGRSCGLKREGQGLHLLSAPADRAARL